MSHLWCCVLLSIAIPANALTLIKEKQKVLPPQYDECGMVFLKNALNLEPKLEMMYPNLVVGEETGEVARVDGGGDCSAAEITLNARLVGENAILPLQVLPSSQGECAWEIPLRSIPHGSRHAGEYQLEVTLAHYNEESPWAWDATEDKTCHAADSTPMSAEKLSLPVSLKSDMGETPLYNSLASGNGRWAQLCEWCHQTFFADRYVAGEERRDEPQSPANPFNSDVKWIARGEPTNNKKALSCQHHPRERYLGGLSNSQDPSERSRCRELSHIQNSPMKLTVRPGAPKASSHKQELCQAGLQEGGWWEKPQAECPNPDELDKNSVPRSAWPVCAWRKDFHKTSEKEWPCKGEWPEDDSKLEVHWMGVGSGPENQFSASADKQCSPEPCFCPAMNLNTKSARQEARAGFLWKGNDGCRYKEFNEEQLHKCLEARQLSWVHHGSARHPPVILRDLEVRYGVNTSSMHLPNERLPDTLPSGKVYVVEGKGFFDPGMEKGPEQLKKRIQSELLSKDYTKDMTNKGSLIFLLSQAEQEWDWDISLPQQEQYYAVAVEALKDSAWSIVDAFTGTRARPSITRPAQMAWDGRSGDGIQFAGVTTPFLHEVCKDHV